MKVLFVVAVTVLALAVVSPLSAEPWALSVDANLTLTQNAYSDNWAGGEAGVLSWTSNSNALAEKQLHSWLHTRNTLKLSFGQTHSQDRETKAWAKPVKSNDLIDLETVWRFTLGGFVDPFVSGRLETQFLDASDPAKERIFNPLTFTESFGVARVLIKGDKREWTNSLGAGLRQHLNREALDTLPNKRQTETTNDGGLSFVSDFHTPMAKERIAFTSKLSLFQALFYSEADKLKGQVREDYWKSLDVNWENTFTASISKYLMVNLYMQLLYDKEIARGGRLKQTLSLGLTYKLI